MSNTPPNLLQGWEIGSSMTSRTPRGGRYILDFYGANVHTATNGKEGVELVERIQPGL